MKPIHHLLILILALVATVASAQETNSSEQLTQMVRQLQRSPTDNALREKIIKLAQEAKPAPTIPDEAEKFDGRAQYAFSKAKSETEFLDAARECLKGIEAAPWVASYYYNLCKFLEKASRPAEAIRAGKLYLVAAPQADDASVIKKLIAGLEYALEREQGSIVKRNGVRDPMVESFEGGAKVARIGNQKISLKLYSVLSGGVWRNQIGIFDITTLPNNLFGQMWNLDPADQTFQLDDRKTGTPWFRLTIGRDGQITFGGNGSQQAEIMTSISELNKLRNELLKQCQLGVKDGNFFIQLLQGGPLQAKDGTRVNGTLFFASDCEGNLPGDKPGWFPAVLIPHPQTPGVTAAESSADAQGFSLAPANACQQERSRTDNLGWLSQ